MLVVDHDVRLMRRLMRRIREAACADDPSLPYEEAVLAFKSSSQELQALPVVLFAAWGEPDSHHGIRVTCRDLELLHGPLSRSCGGSLLSGMRLLLDLPGQVIPPNRRPCRRLCAFRRTRQPARSLGERFDRVNVCDFYSELPECRAPEPELRAGVRKRRFREDPSQGTWRQIIGSSPSLALWAPQGEDAAALTGRRCPGVGMLRPKPTGASGRAVD